LQWRVNQEALVGATVVVVGLAVVGATVGLAVVGVGFAVVGVGLAVVGATVGLAVVGATVGGMVGVGRTTVVVAVGLLEPLDPGCDLPGFTLWVLVGELVASSLPSSEVCADPFVTLTWLLSLDDSCSPAKA
jgi:hypothetical protein